jgi:NAD(P)-dependent dehydrogenase (short-subunit alcohol dehydrogenase family)
MARPRPSDAQPPAPEVVVITGASAGVGRATAHRFARAGARIGLIARGEAPGPSTGPPSGWSASSARSTSGSTPR